MALSSPLDSLNINPDPGMDYFPLDGSQRPALGGSGTDPFAANINSNFNPDIDQKPAEMNLYSLPYSEFPDLASTFLEADAQNSYVLIHSSSAPD